jgi:hypothetical protein
MTPATLTETDLARLADMLDARDAARLDLIADMVAERLTRAAAAPAHGQLVDAATVARELGVTRQTVYARAAELGGVRIGDGPKPRWRFDLEAARDAVACSSSRQPTAENASDDGQTAPPRRSRPRRMPNGLPQPGSILASRPRGGDRRDR